MVKRLLSVVAVVAMTLAASAQSFQAQQFGKNTIFKGNVRKNIVQKSATLDGTIAWGYYMDSSSEWLALGLGSGATGYEFSVGIFVPGDGILAGSKINGISIPVVDTKMSDVSVWVKESLDAEDLARVSISESYVQGELKTVALEEPITIPESGLYVGYTFTNALDYCIATAGNDSDGGLFLSINGAAFDDYSHAGFGASAIQVLLSDLTLPDYGVRLEEPGSYNTAKSSTFSFLVTFTGNGSKDINSLDYTVTVAGQSTLHHVNLDESVAAGFNQNGEFYAEINTPEELGEYEVTVTLDKVNGEANSLESTVTETFKNLTKVVARRTVVEEFTGTGCGWCPRGWAGMERLKKTYPEDFIGIAFHKYNTSDPMYLANYFPTSSLGITGAPGCNMNRLMVMDPYYGASNTGIWNDFLVFNSLLPEVDVNVKGIWSEDQKKVTVDAQVESLADGTNFSLAYVLTADGLTGTTSAWKQVNYYSSAYASSTGMTKEMLPDDLVPFWTAGASATLTFDDVMIGSSYNTSGKNIADNIEGADNTVAGNVYEGSYTITMPTKTTLKNAIDNDKVYAVVLVVDNKTGEILNAAKAKVEAADIPEGITTANAAEEAVEVARYTIDGKLTAAPQRGLNLVRMSDGRVVKMIVK